MGFSIPFTDQDRPRRGRKTPLVQRGELLGDNRRPPVAAASSIQNFESISVQITKAIGLDFVGEDSEQQVPSEMFGRPNSLCQWVLKPVRARLPRCAISSSIAFG
jgi:hypothetical protein